MNQNELFKRTVAPVNDQRTIATPRVQRAGCEYFTGKPSEGPCKRCGHSWTAHYGTTKK